MNKYTSQRKASLRRLLCCIALAGVMAFAATGVRAETQKRLIVLLAGQSNMAGRGSYAALSPTDTVTYDNILSLNKDSVWVRARHPLHWDKSEAGVGMGISFARELIGQMGDDVTIGLVPCAAGGTNIDGWLNDEWFAYTGKFNLYTNLIARAKKAAESGEIVALLWHQGEANASSEASVATYREKLTTLFTRIRNDLNMPDMTIVSGELGRYLSYPYVAETNAIINSLSDDLPRYGAASSEGLTANSDNVHFTAASQIELGKRYADVFLTIENHSTATLTSLAVGAGLLSPAFHPAITEYVCHLPAGTTAVEQRFTTSYAAGVSGEDTIDVSSGQAVATITVTSIDKVTTKTYTVRFIVKDAMEDRTHRIVNNDFELAFDAACNPVPVTPNMNAWNNNAWRPKESPCLNFFGWTCDLSLTGGSTSQGINADGNGKHGDWVCWIGGKQSSYTEFEFSQTIDKSQLTAGTYRVQCQLTAGTPEKKSNHNQRLFANNRVQYYGSPSDYAANLAPGEAASFAGYTIFSDNELREMAVYATIGDDDSLRIGVRTSNRLGNGAVSNQNSPMFRADYFRLTKLDPADAADARAAAIVLSAGSLNFSPETTVYDVELPAGTAAVTATAVANMQDAAVTGNGAVDVRSGTGVSTMTVTALDGVTTRTYTVNYTVASGAGIDEVHAATAAQAACTVVNRTLTVTGADAFTVYSVNGTMVANVTTNVPVELLPGVYVVRTDNSETFKVVIK